MNKCKECLVYLIRNNQNIIEPCLKCGQKTLQWKQNSYGTFYMECSNCGVNVAVDLNTPCELDSALQQKIKIMLMPHNQLPPNNVIIKLGKIFQLNSVTMRKKIEEGFSTEIERSMVDEVLGLLKSSNIAYSIDEAENILKKYPFFTKCNYPYSPIKR